MGTSSLTDDERADAILDAENSIIKIHEEVINLKTILNEIQNKSNAFGEMYLLYERNLNDYADLHDTIEARSQVDIGSTISTMQFSLMKISKEQDEHFKTLQELKSLIETTSKDSKGITLPELKEELSKIPHVSVPELEQSIKAPIKEDLQRIGELISPLQVEITTTREGLNEIAPLLRPMSDVPNLIGNLKQDTDSIKNQMSTVENEVKANNSAFKMSQKETANQLRHLNSAVSDHIQSFNNMSIVFVIGLIAVLVLLFMTIFVIIR